MCSLQTCYSKFDTPKPEQGSPFGPNENVLDLILILFTSHINSLFRHIKGKTEESPVSVSWENEVPLDYKAQLCRK